MTWRDRGHPLRTGASRFIAGTLVGIAIAIPVLAFDLAESYGAVVIVASVVLGVAGIALWVFGWDGDPDKMGDTSSE